VQSCIAASGFWTAAAAVKGRKTTFSYRTLAGAAGRAVAAGGAGAGFGAVAAAGAGAGFWTADLLAQAVNAKRAESATRIASRVLGVRRNPHPVVSIVGLLLRKKKHTRIGAA
jgi:hypothetical protein